MLTFILVFSLVGLLGVSAQVVQDGQCDPNIAVAANFNIDDFLGSWHEVSRTDHPLQGGDCSRVNFERVDGVINVQYEAVARNFYESTTGTLSQEGETARLTLNLQGIAEPVDFWILNTNTVIGFALGYSCVNLGNTQRAVYVWQLGRDQVFGETSLALMNTTLNNLLGITLNDLRDTDFSADACYELPVIGENEAIVLPGQCEELPVVENLDVFRFSGVWHEIASYYSESALGTCARAQYTLAGSIVNVRNSQVVNQGLEIITGTASVISADGSGKLLVTLEVTPGVFVDQELWVLDTDYEDYAVLYSCTDLTGDQKRVYSWITSRTRQQTPAAEVAVTALVDSIMDLNAMYYDTTDQTDEGCFYYPEPVADQPVVFRGLCDMSIPAKADFDPVRYMGLWHEIESYPSVFQTGTCNNAFYELDAATGIVDVFNTQVINQRLDTINGNATIAEDANGTGKLVVSFPIADTEFTTSTDYWVLATDYDNYALVYTCYNIDEDNRGVWSWKLSRTKTLSQQANAEIDAIIATIPVLDERYYQQRDQSVNGCFYFPEAQPGVPVVFPGQCDESLTAVPDFSLNLFEGVWHEIQAYPKLEQSGECINHAFGASGNTMTLESSQIVDQFLTLTSGNVAFTSNDGSAKLVITIVSDGQVIEIPYWILNTDYTDYALAYSCVNINNDFRGIWSWKLSRTKQLSPQANTNIDATISSIEVLDNVYYEPVDQSDPACFFLPELEPGEPIVLVGQCQADIPVVQNFDAARYLGRWRLIESYPSDFQNGTCNDATYTLGDGVVDVVNTQVIDERLDSIDGTAVLVNENDGKLLVTFPGAEPLEYWILDTDYDTYSLVYSCVNLDSERRRVWSWKMSRTRELSDTAVANIDEIINGIDVLNNRYFAEVDNSDSACFYYPEPNGNAVVFRGQCDESISVVTGFDVQRYMGLWYDIESYPQEFQNGTCSTATYTLTDEGVEVYNTQVINERLDFIYGLAVPDNDEGLAKLIVTFPVFGTNFTIDSPYWVLDTDYDNYALVYACQNLDEDSRRVTSWKLSRQRTLSAASQAAISAVVNNVQVLSEEYYGIRDHTDDGCFYFPEPDAGKPVVFPGQCDDSIQAEANFDLERFAGLWHETAAYPKIEQEGQCVNYDFTTATTDSFSLYTTQVIDLLLDETNATVVRTSSDNSARFTITIYNAGETITIPYWIISTDYDNYALAYSCVNQGPNYRGVWSWKLSRTRQMSTASESAISQAMANIDVLAEQYFEDTSQTDASCFYLPDLGPQDPVVFRGQCDQTINVVQNFDPVLYQGRWRLIESYQSDFQTGTCNDATYTLQDDGVLVYNTQVIDESLDTITGSAVLATTDGSGKLLVTFPDAPEPIEYWILDTDYSSYSLIYSCVNIGSDQRRVWSWKMSRDSSLSPGAITAINSIVSNINVLDEQYYYPIDQSDTACFYFPEPNGNPVFFRGQCDESISVVSNFDVGRYMGLWYDIESYPQTFQNGTCSTATYTLLESGVEVYNTQVVNERLDFIYGSAVPISDDGLAKLEVTFVIPGTNIEDTSPYWVLSTDYDNYALVYSCVNIDFETRRVSSWKLSRERTLSQQSETQIANAINNVQVLRDDYYEYRDHTDDGCFYYPEPEAGKPVVFPGQCDESLQAMPEFDLERFSGLWHEIEAYPKDQQAGQCVNYDFEATSANTLGLYTTQVINRLLDETNATVQRTSADNSARFVITINVDGSPIEIPYWIIATDYDNYAVAYSCVNQGPYYRGVWSWKLSRTRQMSAESNADINQAIANIPVLSNEYYEATSQSDESCFYLPVLGPNDPVVFVGQCDPNIPVIQNFDPARYEGRWRLIESYASAFQTGTCNDATYTIQGDGSVLVYNTQVIDESLDTITGSAVLATADGSGKLLVTFPDAPEPLEYWILDTDYETYSLVYSCANINSEQRQVWSWKLSRTTSLPESASAIIDSIVDTVNVLDEQYYSDIDNSDTACFYFPVPDGRPVVFRGQCDDTTSVVSNFDIPRYMGTWYDIASYPQAFQDGTCATATYTLTEDGVLVYNTQVIDQLLDNINATAVPASDDGLAKLIVTFPIAGTDLFVETPYWVLDTDYDNYALVYSCSNIDSEYRSVTSWKLSREQELSAASETAINAAINNVQVLANQYYVERGHTEEDCFYYPDNFGGPVVLNGQCEEQDVVTNFNLNQFAGTWHETARFPSDEQTGECAANELTINQNSFILTQTIVYNERLTTVSGPATVSEDGRGIITATLQNDEGVSIETTLYVLDTDYNEFALLFSCTELGDESKQVYSWKLSRSRSGLSPSANERIDAIVTGNIDLYEGYYEYTDQTNDGCFHYPVFEEPPPAIVLPGPCYEGIQAKPNFDVNGYLGRWFEIEKYPQRDQVGECSRAHYNEGQGEAPVDVMNTIVYNQTLEIREGTAVPASNDGSGLLTVTFILDDGVVAETNYYVLETDYNNFALVYSCRDLDNGDSEVYSWKLSRQPSLSIEANNIINNVISNTRGLLQEYYEPTSQSDEDCFYIPDVNPDEATLFRGQCEEITGMAGFDMSRYVGWWHEIARYSSDNNVGECTSSQYSAAGNSFQVVDTNVIELEGRLTTGTVVASNNGLLTRTMSNGQTEAIWVLDTDYETYSLLYSCTNTDDGEYRRVWSAKHSKSRSLSEAAEDAMQQIIDTNSVLYDQFYLEVDQSPSACFHYPEPNSERVILPGQCDDNIPTVTSFDPVQYTGIWYQIERYPYPEVSNDGTCVGTRYTYNTETEEMTVLNWDVIDGTLQNIEGTAEVDGAKLIVTLPVEGTNDTTTTTLYILNTDYVTYSLAYTCTNVNEFQRAVVAFKLSRTRDMPASGTTAINNYMATREELNQDYFIMVEHNEDCLEPSSALLIKSSFVVMLVCIALQMFL